MYKDKWYVIVLKKDIDGIKKVSFKNKSWMEMQAKRNYYPTYVDSGDDLNALKQVWDKKN